MTPLSFNQVLFAVVTLCVVGVSVYAILVLRQLRSTLAELEDLQTTLAPRIERISQETEETLRSLKKVSQHIEGASTDIEMVTHFARRKAIPALESAATVLSPLRQAAALVVGMHAGLSALASDSKKRRKS